MSGDGKKPDGGPTAPMYGAASSFASEAVDGEEGQEPTPEPSKQETDVPNPHEHDFNPPMQQLTIDGNEEVDPKFAKNLNTTPEVEPPKSLVDKTFKERKWKKRDLSLEHDKSRGG